MSYTTEKTANELKSFFVNTPYFLDFTHYNSYYEVRYLIPKQFISLDTPMWSHIKSIFTLTDNFQVTISIFEDSSFIKEYALKYSPLEVK